ncbi:MAG: amino acid permease [Nanoarchaeota archaeon]|nr:amino acid permease [Nanoarchaeota archaeon]
MTIPKSIHPNHHHKKFIEKKSLTLRRDLTLFQATCAGVGIILGAGVYALIGVAAGASGNSIWLSFFFAALVAAFTGLSYAELSSMFPKDAGEYLYTEHAFGKRLAFVIGYLVVLAGIVSAAAVALGFSGYFTALFNFGNLILIAIVIIILFSLLNFYGIKQSSYVNVLFTIIEVFGLLFIIAIAVKYFGRVDYLEMPHGFTGVLSAAALIFFAYIGFDSIVKFSEETKNASKIIPRALVLSIIISTILYILIAVSVVSILDWQVLAASTAPLADVAAVVFGSYAFILIAVIALFATGNTVLISLIVTSRMLYGMGKEGFIKAFGNIHPTRRTPHIAILATTILAIIFALIGDIGIVAEITNFTIFTVFIAVNAALIWLRYKEPDTERGFKMPLNIGKFPILALLGIITTAILLVHLKMIVVLLGMGIILVGFLLYSCFWHFNNKNKNMEKQKGKINKSKVSTEIRIVRVRKR